MKYFKQLGIQPIIATPTERGKIIAKYVETNILTIKVNNVIEARPFISLIKEEPTEEDEDEPVQLELELDSSKQIKEDETKDNFEE